MQQKLNEDLGFDKSITRKKTTKIAFYRTTERVQNLRASFRAMIQNYHPFNFIYIDEALLTFIVKQHMMIF
jgi:hypothetical protein